MATQQAQKAAPKADPDRDERDRRASEAGARRRLLAGIPVAERRLELAGVSTAVLEGGNGPPVVLVHEQGAFAPHWMRVIPSLVTTHRVIAPDLPGHGASEVTDSRLDAAAVLAWLGEVIEHTCPSPPALVGHMLGGAIGARFAVGQSDRLSRLVLVDSFGLRWFRPALGLAVAVARYAARPSERTHDGLLQTCTVDFEGWRDEMADDWTPFQQYVVERARTPSLKAAFPALMRKVGMPAIPRADLERIAVPTTLIWGRQDKATPLRTAEQASARYGWPLEVIEDCGDDPPLERPGAFLRALRAALAQGTAGSERQPAAGAPSDRAE